LYNCDPDRPVNPPEPKHTRPEDMSDDEWEGFLDSYDEYGDPDWVMAFERDMEVLHGYAV
jgi:hypothetical protein